MYVSVPVPLGADCATCVQVPREARRRRGISWNWSYSVNCRLWVLGSLIPDKNSKYTAGLSLQIMISVLKHHMGRSAEGTQWGNGDREIRKETDLVQGKS